MTHPLLYNIRKVLMSKTVLISMALLIAISFFLVYSFSATTTSQFQNPNGQVLSWYDSSGTYHFLVFDTNQYGQPVSGVQVQISMNFSSPQFFNNGQTTNSQSSSSFPGYRSSAVTTNSSGIAALTISVPPADINEVNANYSVSIQFNQANGFSNGFGGGTPYIQPRTLPNGSSVSSPVSPGEVVSVFSGPITTVTDSSNSQKQNIMVTWAGPNGSVPSGYSLYYKFINSTCSGPGGCFYSSPAPNSLSESNMSLVGNLAKYNQVFSPPKLEPNLGNVSQIVLALFYNNGTATTTLSQYIYFPVSQLYPISQPISVGQSNQIVISFFSTIFGIFIPLIAIIGSYNSYGKDRVSGVLESILAQPISRRGLSLSRFFSSFAGMAIAISISMGVVDAIVYYYTKVPFNSTLLLSSAGAFFVELGAFIGIMMLLSRVIKSSGLLIGIGIGLFLVFDLFWNVIILVLVSASGAGFGSNAYQGLQVAGEFVNPAQFIQLVIAYLTSQGPFGPFSPTQYGIIIPSLVITGILWVLLPLVGFLYLAIKRD
jgi:ABC-2 type transport system permease protein